MLGMGRPIPNGGLARTGPGSKIPILGFSVTRQTALPIRIVTRFYAGGAFDSKSQLAVVESHGAAMIQTLTSHVAANQLAAGAFFAR